MAKRGLGRGLAALIPTSDSHEAVTLTPPPPVETMERSVRESGREGQMQISVHLISTNPYQPRTQMDENELEELTRSIATQGLLQPVIVRRASGSYQLVAGERRWQAAKRAGLESIPAIVRQCSEREMLELAIVENLQRSEINALDAAKAYRRLSDEFALTQDEIATRVGKSRSAIANTLRLLDLPVDVQSFIADGKLSEGHARALLMCKSPQAARALARRVVAESLSVRQAERLAKRATPAQRLRSPATTMDANVDDILDRLRRRMATGVRIVNKNRGGTIEIDFFNEEQLTRIVDLLLGTVDRE